MNNIAASLSAPLRTTLGAVLVYFILFLLVATLLADERAELQRLQLRATTEAYREAALQVLLAEVNQIARELELHEQLPIKRSDLLETRINTPFWSDSAKAFGFVSTSNYYYYASVGNRLSSIVPNFGPDDIGRTDYMETLKKRLLLPKAQMDTNAAYRMATQWLTKIGIDVQALERDAQRVDISAWEIGGRFVPVYLLRWQRLAVYRGDDSPPSFASLASIEFVAPERRILQISVNQPRFLKRKPLTVPDRDRLLQKTDDSKLRELWFTTEAYKASALEVMLKEVNWVARVLRLPEGFPIDSAALTEVIVGTPYTADHQGCFAAVQTKKHSYWASQKLTTVSRLYSYGEEEFLASIRTRYTMPSNRMNGDSAYALATQWLAAISVDVKRLEADYPSRITVPWDLGNQGVPLFEVEWSRPIEGTRRRDVAARVEVLEPERSLERLVIEKPEYMKRAPLVVLNREKLLQPVDFK